MTSERKFDLGTIWESTRTNYVWHHRFHCGSIKQFLRMLYLRVSRVGSPAAEVTFDTVQGHQAPAWGQSAQCSAVRGGPAGRRSHPGWKNGGNQLAPKIFQKEKIATNTLIYGGNNPTCLHCIFYSHRFVIVISLWRVLPYPILQCHFCHLEQWRASLYRLHSVQLVHTKYLTVAVKL